VKSAIDEFICEEGKSRVVFNYLFREFKNTELKLLMLVLVLAIFCVSMVEFFIQGIHASIEESSGTLLGGDRVIKSNSPIEPSIIEKAHELGLMTSQTINFYSMLVHEDDFALAEVKGIDVHYPLKGEVLGTAELFGKEEALKMIPESGELWLEEGLLSLLKVNVNDTVKIGEANFIITQILTVEPDRGGEELTFAPRAMISFQDVAKTQVIQPGSRQTYKLLLSGPDTALAEFETWVLPKLKFSQRLLTPENARPAVTIFFDQGEKYLNVILLLNLIIASAAVYQASKRYSIKQYRPVALLRCLGADFDWILFRFLSILIFYGLIAGILGLLLGFGCFSLLRPFLEEIVMNKIESVWTIPALMSGATLFVLMLGFSLPSIIKLKYVQAISIFKQSQGPRVTDESPFLIRCKQSIVKLAGKFGVEVRYGFSNVLRYPFENGVQIVIFGLVMGSALLLFLLQNDLIQAWREKIPPQAPNYFAINIAPESQVQFQDLLTKNNIKTEKLYPIVRARLLSVNNEIVESDDSKPKSRQLRRLLNLTSTMSLPKDNKIVHGKWFTPQDTEQQEISVEQDFAERFNIRLYDRLKFQIAEKEIEAIVTSLRSVDWNSFNPVFFVIFPPKMLENFPVTYMTSFYLPSERNSILRELVHLFPEINLIDTTVILKNLNSILKKLVVAVETLWVLTGLMALILMYCTLILTLDERLKNAILLRALGVGRKKLFILMLSEYIILGVFASLIAVVGANAAYAWLASDIFKLSYRINSWALIMGPLIGMSVIVLAGGLGLRKIINISPVLAFSLRR